MEHPNAKPVGQSGKLNVGYIKSLEGLLKIAEIQCLLLAFACLTGQTLHYPSPTYGDRFNFFYFVTVASWLLVMILFVIFALTLTDKLDEKFGSLNWCLVMAIYSAVTAFLLLISTALVLDTAIRFRRSERLSGGIYKPTCELVACGNIEAAGAFGIFSTVLFSVDTICFCIKNKRTSSAPPMTSEEEPYDDIPQKEPPPY